MIACGRNPRKILLVIGLCFLFKPLAFGTDTPAFLIFSEGADGSKITSFLETGGAHVRARIPPQILIADLPPTFNPSSIPSIKTVYRNLIPLSALQPYGLMAVAAGMEWNQQIIHLSSTQGAQSYGAMRAMAAQKNLSAPQNFHAVTQDQTFHCSWTPVLGALFYQLQASFDAGFSKIELQTKTIHPEVQLSFPLVESTQPLYLRVRAADRPNSEKADEDIYGAWAMASLGMSIPLTIDNSMPAPLVTSPVTNFESQGFNIILEWSVKNGIKSRVQISKANNFKETVVDEVVPSALYVCPSSALHLGDSLYWRVQAIERSSSPWSDARHFIVGSPRHVDSDALINPEAPK
jgi:hypothetical protein